MIRNKTSIMIMLSRIIFIFPVIILVSACSLFGGDERPQYQSAEYYKNLEVPPNLTRPDTTDAIQVPQPSKEALQRFIDNNKLSTIITPRFKGIRVVSYAGSSWLEVDASVEKVWPELLKFIQREGIAVAQERPLLGFVETKWINRKTTDAGFVKSLFQRFEPDQKDKFRFRLERFDKGNKTRIFVTYRGIERENCSGSDGGYIWVTLPADIAREREMVGRMALYAGLSGEQKQQLMKNYGTYASLVKLDPDNGIALLMTGSPDFVYRRALRALDRMGIKDVHIVQKDKTIDFTLGKISDKSLNIKEDKLSKTSWMMQLFEGDKKSAKANSNHPFELVFTDKEGAVQIKIVDKNNHAKTEEDGDVSGSVLAEQFRKLFAANLE